MLSAIYIACCLEEETICLEQYEFKCKENHVPDDVFVHIDIPLTIEHQIHLMKNAGFRAAVSYTHLTLPTILLV